MTAVLRALARLAVLGVSVPTALLAAAFQVEREHWWWLELLHYVPYPAFLLPALAAFALSFFVGAGWRLAASLSLALVLTSVMGLAVGRADAGSQPVRLMTYNVKAWLAEHRPSGFEPLVREIAAHDADVVVMQDAGDLAAARERRPSPVQALFDGRQVYAFGQYIVASRFPLRDCRPGQIPYDGEAHDYVRCIVDARGVEADLVVVHFRSPRDGLNATRHERAEGLVDWRQNVAERMAQSRKLAADLAPRARPLIVAGDLNAPESSPVVRRLFALGLRDAFSSAGLGYGYTHGHALRLGISFLRIDHILVSPEIGVHDAWVGGKDASEHRPVIADLLMRRAAH